MMKEKNALAVLLLAGLLAGQPASAIPEPVSAQLVPAPIYSEITQLLAERLPEEHLTSLPLDDTISSRTWTNYLGALDATHLYFTASDIEAFQTHKFSLDEELRAGDLSFAYDAFNVFRSRVRDRCRYVETLLANGFDLSKQEYYHWQRKAAPWPADQAEQDELWRKQVKNEYVRWLVTQVADPNTNAAPDATVEAAQDDNLNTPEATILKRYSRFLTILEDSDSEWVLERFLSAFAQAYDPHSDYMSPSAVEDFSITMSLKLVGIGALLSSDEGAAKIVQVIPGGPAHRDKRLQTGDRIIAVAQENEAPVDILHWPLRNIVKLIRGEKNTKVILTIIPASDLSGTTTRRIELVRDEVKLEDQAASSEIRTVTGANGVTNRLGIVKLPAFYYNMNARSPRDPEFRSAYHDVATILAELKTAQVDGIILDLRNNGGGSLLEAVNMTGLFIRTGPTVQVNEGRRTRVLKDEDPFIAYRGPLVVLVNHLSASASEIVAGALQDYGRAIVVGDAKTHGKGTVQSLIELGSDKALGNVKITTASYYRISGASTQLKGVSPDITLRSPLDNLDLGEEFLPNPIPWSRIPAAYFSKTADLSALTETLRRRSEQRRAADSRFKTYYELLDRIKSINETKELPLALEERRHFHQEEKDMAELQKKLAPEALTAEASKDDGNPDVVLDETLMILSDMAALAPDAQLQPEPATAQATGPARSVAQIISDWFKSNP